MLVNQCMLHSVELLWRLEIGGELIVHFLMLYLIEDNFVSIIKLSYVNFIICGFYGKFYIFMGIYDIFLAFVMIYIALFIGYCACMLAQLCLTLCDPLNCGPPSSSVRRIFQVRILEWVVISFFRGSSWLRDWTRAPVSPALAGRFFNTEPLGSPY